MLNHYLLFILILSTFPTNAQLTTIVKQSFEPSGDTWKPVNFSAEPCSINGDSWNYLTNLGSIIPSDGSQFWGIRDLNGDCGGSGFESLTLPDVDISLFRSVILSFDYNVFGFDSGDDIKYEIFYDGNSQGEIILVDGYSNFSSNGWQTETILIPNIVSHVKIIIYIKQNGQDDYAGIDNIKLQGNVIRPCNDLMISEYIEGTSSTDYRNNFIEIYNPTTNTINLVNFDLVKFTGSSTEVSASLKLSGSIPAYGTYLIEDHTENLDINADLSTNSTVMDFNGDDKIALRNSGIIIDLIGVIGDSENFAKDISLRRKSNIQTANDQFDEQEWDIYHLEDITNIDQHSSTCSGTLPEIELFGNLNAINDGDLIPSSSNNTYFGGIDSTSGEDIFKIFTIKNAGTDLLEIISVDIKGTDASEFSIENSPVSNIHPNDSIEFQIRFKPSSKGIKTATVSILNNDDSENPFDFKIQAEGTGMSSSPLIISQYYEGSGNNKWIEITNISETTSPVNTYYLAIYRNEDAKSPVGIKPSSKKSIPALNSGQTLKYCATLNVNTPLYAIDGNEIKTIVCSFNGDDIILISTSDDESCWEDKVDIIGNDTNWGIDKSFVRKYGCEKVEPSTGYDPIDWIPFEITEINSAKAGLNHRIGEHFIGPTTFENLTHWDNGLPDKNRNIIIDSDYYSSSRGNFEACNLTVNSGSKLEINGGDYISITNDLLLNGSLEVLNEGSLIMIDDSGSVINNGSSWIRKTTTPFKKFDYTYWSSPVTNANLEEVFSASPQNSFFKFETQNFGDENEDSYDDDKNAWQATVGRMELGKGYTAMSPNTDPFIDTQSVIFSGEVNNGLIEVPIFLSLDHTDENDDWNLIGNPYPSAMDAELFLNDDNNRSILGGTIYFWTHNTSAFSDDDAGTKYSADDYAIYTIGTGGVMANSAGKIPSGIIASAQGFFIEAIQSGTIRFKNEMRVKQGNDDFFKTEQSKNDNKIPKDKIWLNLYNDQGGFSQILIGFIEGADGSYEQKYDGLRLEGNSFISFYSLVEDKHLAIQGTHSYKGDENIPLGYSSYIEEEHILKISLDHLEGKITESEIYLFDKLLQKMHNLKLGSYQFITKTGGVFNDRFFIHFNNGSLTTEETEPIDEGVVLKNSVNHISLSTSSLSMISSVEVYDILGRTIVKIHSLNDNTLTLNKEIFHSTGIYIIRIKLENSKILIKKFIF